MTYPDLLVLPRFTIRHFMPFVLPQADGQGASNAKPALTTETCKEDSMADSHLPDADLLHKILRYEPDTGKLYWRERTLDMFQSGRGADCRRWNAQFAGKQAFTALSEGYHKGRITIRGQGFNVSAHRVIWCMIYGVWPDQIDHINQDKADNRIANLRLTDREANARNCRLSVRNRSGRIGVHWRSRDRKWRAKIRHDGRYIILGLFSRFEDACEARAQAEKRYGYDPQHGKRRKS